MTDPQFVLYTYQFVPGQPSGHVYGPTSEAIAHAKGIELAEVAKYAGQPHLAFLVFPLEGLPE